MSTSTDAHDPSARCAGTSPSRDSAKGRKGSSHQFPGLIFFTSASDGRTSLPSTKRHSFM